MWLLTQFLIPCVTSGQGPVKRSRSGQVIKIYFLLIFIYNFAPILYPTGWNFCVVGAPTGQAIARPVCKYFLILKFFGENFFSSFRFKLREFYGPLDEIQIKNSSQGSFKSSLVKLTHNHFLSRKVIFHHQVLHSKIGIKFLSLSFDVDKTQPLSWHEIFMVVFVIFLVCYV